MEKKILLTYGSEQKYSIKNDQALKCSSFLEENGQRCSSIHTDALPAKSLERAVPYYIWKCLIASRGDGKDLSNAAWNLNKRGSQKTMAPDNINPCKSPAGYKAIIKNGTTAQRLLNFVRHLSLPRREVSPDMPNPISPELERLFLFPHQWKFYICLDSLSQCWCFPARERCHFAPFFGCIIRSDKYQRRLGMLGWPRLFSCVSGSSATNLLC